MDPTLSRIENPNSPWKRPEGAQVYYQMSRAGVIELARKAGALVTFGKRQLIFCPRCDEYLLNTSRFEDGTKSE